MKYGPWEVVIREKEGWDLMAPLSYWNASQEEIEKKTGGCGPGGLGDWFVPDTMYGESVFLACQIHDWMYGEGKDWKDKALADRVFMYNMLVLIEDKPFEFGPEDQGLDKLRERRVMTYYQAVYHGGEDAFFKGKSPLNDTPEVMAYFVQVDEAE
jgi:hypothetical protein